MYIHYGCDHFDLSKFKPIKNAQWGHTKPESGGFWASDVNAEWGWKQWSLAEHFCVKNLDKSFCFELAEDARVLHLRSINDLNKLKPIEIIFKSTWFCPDFEEAATRYDAIELHLSDEPKCEHYDDSLYFKLYGWDCDSILIMNPDIIQEVSVL